MLLLMQNSIHKIKYLLFLSWDWEAWCLTQSGGVIPPKRNIAWNKGQKCFHCLWAPNNLIRPCIGLHHGPSIHGEFSFSGGSHTGHYIKCDGNTISLWYKSTLEFHLRPRTLKMIG